MLALASSTRCREVTLFVRAIAGVAIMAVAISAADSSLSLVIQVLHLWKANPIWLLRVAGLASGDCRATEWIRWLCYSASIERLGRRSIYSDEVHCWDKHRYRRPNIRVRTSLQSRCHLRSRPLS